ncbi:MAG: heparan-alpha-glucosaminide N-acetyltransferase domain-containing protein [Bacteroidota bacterium]|nr:heparan-alpha-glucosaminide N-acetyltransferase domain-containing protein [Bacteroidota bacterium]MDX5404918.1 heparan-alpha-glucosaminide N-acetyltransferase domain-containing protein [Bacteroidota bacterium]MDX5428941.1 heparan-alpha-glucosaminide N-acetyltransferase domain-containing protein [Bacteroidota bacterium]MDX5446785.1 heparan-alpha-glucosaminide N-acetyltransferase domain-containing protein [Bacteroidota bacterium]MDX5506621.1 heparan-alpha-glucosaminide N-acetyltransferase doma
MEITKSYRISSIDLLRGLVMVIMALDHVRDYFHADAYLFDPLDPEKTYPALFFTRWITHFCAPVFVFLAGTSAYLVGQRKSRSELSRFLWTRGLWLVILEVTVVVFGWTFNPAFPSLFLQVIWAIGISMILLSLVVWLPFRAILALGISIVLFHNLLDPIHFESPLGLQLLWALVHDPTFLPFADGRLFVAIPYPVLPWLGIMILGYAFGRLYQSGTDPKMRKSWLSRLGWGAIIGFLVLRGMNIYGDPLPWETRDSFTFTLLSFLDVTKYPPSLLFTLMTLGPALLLLRMTEGTKVPTERQLVTFGRVPLFFYVLHIYLAHFLAMIAAELAGYGWKSMILDGWVNFAPGLEGFGYSLWVVYAVWILVILISYPLCRWYMGFKLKNKDLWWISYV